MEQKNWNEVNGKSRPKYNTNSHVTTLLKSTLCDYNDADILVKGTTTVPNSAVADIDANNANKNLVIFKNYAPFINCISKTKNIQVDNAKDIDIVNANI